MREYKTPHFIIKKNLQKSNKTGVYFSDVVTPDILRDVCYRITGQTDYKCQYVDNAYQDDFLEATYNKGRLAIMKFHRKVFYISFSETNIGGRDSSIQSVPTAFNMYYSNPYPDKELCYYFLPHTGNAETAYHSLIYRLMETTGFRFLNPETTLSSAVVPFVSVNDIMLSRDVNSGRNRANNSSYVTKASANNIEIYGKTYGANKYVTSLMSYAISMLAQPQEVITLFEVSEGNLSELPCSSLTVLEKMGNVQVCCTDLTLEKRIFDSNDNLRSPIYTFNLLGRLGTKKCALCGCEIPEIIQGAHAWPVSSIKRETLMSYDEKLKHALSGDNGMWLCENHHKLFDSGIIKFDENGKVAYRNHLEQKHIAFLDSITTLDALPDFYMSDLFVQYLRLGNRIAV